MARFKTGLLIALVIISGYLATLLMSVSPSSAPGPGRQRLVWAGARPF